MMVMMIPQTILFGMKYKSEQWQALMDEIDPTFQANFAEHTFC